MQNIMLRKDIIVQVTATIFLVAGLALAVHFGTFI